MSWATRGRLKIGRIACPWRTACIMDAGALHGRGEHERVVAGPSAA